MQTFIYSCKHHILQIGNKLNMVIFTNIQSTIEMLAGLK